MPDFNTEPVALSNPVLVVGTTPDYVLKIKDSYRKPILFVMDSHFKGHPLLKKTREKELLFCSLEHLKSTITGIRQRLDGLNTAPRGVACFDCESLLLAGQIARYFQKPFPSPAAITRARNKFASRSLWMEAGIKTPRAITASGLNHTLDFYHDIERPVVLKPLSGSGSELVFKCDDEREISEAVRVMQEQLLKRRSSPFFTDIRFVTELDPCQTWIVEEFISGPEYSCDFILTQDGVFLVRETSKLKTSERTCGTVLAYTYPPRYPTGFSSEGLSDVLAKAAVALGFSWGYFMVDFIIKNGQAYILEMTPRPGGDSIPDLVKTASGYDILGGYMDFMCSHTIPEPSLLPGGIKTHAGINFFADRPGLISRLDFTSVLRDPVVKNLVFKKKLGDRVILPPDNYDDRLLGYCIINLKTSRLLLSQYRSFLKRIKVSITN